MDLLQGAGQGGQIACSGQGQKGLSATIAIAMRLRDGTSCTPNRLSNGVDMKINIAKQFSPNPAGRWPSEGPYSGQRFREEILVPALKSVLEKGGDERVEIDLDGSLFFSSAFLKEAFGGLARVPEISFDEALKILDIKYSEQYQKFHHDFILWHLDRAKCQNTVSGA